MRIERFIAWFAQHSAIIFLASSALDYIVICFMVGHIQYCDTAGGPRVGASIGLCHMLVACVWLASV